MSTTPNREDSYTGGERKTVDKLADTFFPVYERYFSEENNEFAGTVDLKLGEASRDIPVELFLSRAIGYGAIVGGSLWLVSLFVLWVIFGLLGASLGTLVGLPVSNPQLISVINMVKLPVVVLVTAMFFGTIGFATGFASPIMMLYLESSSREREINMLLPDAVAFMYALSIGGMNQLDILEAAARADDVYGEISKEFEIILQETRYFGVDYRTAIRNRALETPSTEFGQFLTDMLSILNSGGDMTSFLDDKRQKYMRTASQAQERTLETLELFGEMYMTLSLFPLLLIILLVIMTLIGNANNLMLYGTVYIMIPMTGIIFIVLISTVKTDDPGDGILVPDEGDPYIQTGDGAFGLGVIEQFNTPWGVMNTIRNAEGTFRAKRILKRPDKFLLENPPYTFAITVPITLALIGYSFATGLTPTTWTGMKQHVVWGTFMYMYVPLYVIATPYAIAYELKSRRRRGITDKLSDNLRKLASANDTGQTLLESFETVADTSSGLLAHEFEVIHSKVQYGTSMKQALIEFNNKYHRPRLARMMKLIAKAQETSSNITPVLKTAADASEQADDMDKEQVNRSRMQIVIIIMTFLTLLAVMAILKTQFLDVMAKLTGSLNTSGGSASGLGFGGVHVKKLSLLFFHAVTFQAIMASFISGYLRSGRLQDAAKYLLVLPTIALIVWMFI